MRLAYLLYSLLCFLLLSACVQQEQMPSAVPPQSNFQQVEEKDPGMLERFKQAKQESARVIGQVGHIIHVLQKVIGFMGFKVCLIFILSILGMIALHITGIAHGKPAFFSALLCVLLMWYASAYILFPESEGDLLTLVKTAGWVALPTIVLSSLGYLFSKVNYFIRRWYFARTYKKNWVNHADAKNNYALRKEVYDASYEYQQLMHHYDAYLQSDTGDKKSQWVNVVKHKQRLARRLGFHVTDEGR